MNEKKLTTTERIEQFLAAPLTIELAKSATRAERLGLLILPIRSRNLQAVNLKSRHVKRSFR